MTGEELDREMRQVLVNATRGNIISSVARLVELGFGTQQSAAIVLKIIDDKEGACERKHVWFRRRRHGMPFGPCVCRRCGTTRPVRPRRAK